MRVLLLCLIVLSLLRAEHPTAFSPLGEALETELEQLRALSVLPSFEASQVDAYADEQQACFETGYALDAAVRANATDAGPLRLHYLSCLRTLEKRGSRWQHLYALTLTAAIDADDRERFALLTTHPLTPLQRPSLRQKALAYYEGFRNSDTIAAMEAIRDDMRIEERSAAFLSTEKSAFVKAQSVLDGAEAEKSDRPVLVTAEQQASRFVFYARNRNIYPVTVTIDLPQSKNVKASRPLPLHFELAPHAKRKVLEVPIVDRTKGASFRSRYGWVMGRMSARHSDPLYRLPFAVGSRAKVSQGFDGGVTHKGLTRYAVDFACPVGTKIYAARDGRVVATESRHNKGGFDKRFGSEANYIIIEHEDHTFGKYYHLKQYGVMVRVGTYVHRGDFIGYSGNTGYSSGPHLHFSVSSVDPASKTLPITLPFRFYAAKGEVRAPKSGDVYTVQRLR